MCVCGAVVWMRVASLLEGCKRVVYPDSGVCYVNKGEVRGVCCGYFCYHHIHFLFSSLHVRVCAHTMTLSEPVHVVGHARLHNTLPPHERRRHISTELRCASAT